MDRKTIARKATAEALRTRVRAGYGLDAPVCVYDLAGRLGVEVRFFDLPSMEGVYYNSPKPHIVLSSLRPAGRRAFTCGHELGHHSRGDGTCLDEIVEQWVRPRFDPKEFYADCFAGALLMPKTAVERAFALRKWAISDCTPDQVYAISNYFGVGYVTLVHHLSRGPASALKLSRGAAPEDRATPGPGAGGRMGDTRNRVGRRRALGRQAHRCRGWRPYPAPCEGSYRRQMR